MKAALKCFNCAFVFRSADKMAGNQYADGCPLAAPGPPGGKALDGAPQKSRCSSKMASNPPAVQGAQGTRLHPGGLPAPWGAPGQRWGPLPRTLPSERAPLKPRARSPVLRGHPWQTPPAPGSRARGGGCAHLKAKLLSELEDAGRIKRSPWLRRLKSDVFISRADIWILSALG